MELADGSCEYERYELWELDFSIYIRQKVKNMSTDELDKMLRYINRSYGEVLGRNWKGLELKYGPIKSYLKVREENYFSVSGDIIILNMDSWDGVRNYDDIDRENDFFYPDNLLDREKRTFQIPDDYEVLHMPEDVELDIGFFNFSRKFTTNENNQIVVMQEDRLKRATVPAEEAERVQKFFKGLFRASDQRIIFQKRKSFLDELKEFLSRMLVRVF